MVTLFLLSALFLLCKASQLSQEAFDVQSSLVSSLHNSSYALFTIRKLFYPEIGSQPVCATVTYELLCNDTDFTYNGTYLWTTYDSGSFVGQILLSSAYYGIVLKGFDWESNCYDEIKDETVLPLELLSCDALTDDTNQFRDQLLALTASVSCFKSSLICTSKDFSLTRHTVGYL